MASCSRSSKEDANSKPNTREEPALTARGQTESESQPDSDQIEEDCLRFVRSTRTVPTKSGKADCPDCPAAEGTPILDFVGMHIDQISPSGSTCSVAVTLHATFVQSTSQEITDGLVGWISQEQRSRYLNGETPSGEQVYRVMVTYSREGDEWRAVEFEPR